MEELKLIVEESKPDIIALTEILPKNTLFDPWARNLNLEGYNQFNNKDKDFRRGVAIYIRDNLDVISLDDGLNYQEAVWCKITLNKSDSLLLGCVYRSPNCDGENFTQLSELFGKASSTSHSHLLILGEFNLKEINWKENTTDVNEQHVSSKFLELTHDFFLYQHVLHPTRLREGNIPSVLDLILTNEENMIDSLEYKSSIGPSDHLSLVFKFVCYTEDKVGEKPRLKYFKADYAIIREELSKVEWGVMNIMDLTEFWEFFTEIISKVVKQNIPVSKGRTGKGKDHHVLDRNTLEAVKIKRRKWKKYIHCKTASNFTSYQKARNLATRAIRNNTYNHEELLANKIRIEPKLFWKYVRNKVKTKEKLTQLDKGNGELTKNDLEKAEVLNNHYASVFVDDGQEPLPQFQDHSPNREISRIEISEEKIFKASGRLKVNKAAGPDNIHPKFLKETADQIKIPLKYIFEKSVADNCLLKSWKQANVTPIF
ncbi:uncharacterized protein LOC110463320 [Mizuhopecten yessoensis]|uniref:uncharacterized protein LOC110463320 n=1 Tax=Mizuhopecten yessoensis TaxID=6573 RepID=UPI000B459773|nr:uncharacterized protein LOC110463320 [Mizuhopecten yessoensis]